MEKNFGGFGSGQSEDRAVEFNNPHFESHLFKHVRRLLPFLIPSLPKLIVVLVVVVVVVDANERRGVLGTGTLRVSSSLRDSVPFIFELIIVFRVLFSLALKTLIRIASSFAFQAFQPLSLS